MKDKSVIFLTINQSSVIKVFARRKYVFHYSNHIFPGLGTRTSLRGTIRVALVLISVLEVAAAMVVSVMISVVAGTVVGTVESGWEMLMAMVDCGFGNNEWFDTEIITEIQRTQEHMVI